MRAVVQRVQKAAVTVDSAVVGRIDHGLLVLVGVGEGDDESSMRLLADRIVGMRIFSDDAGKFQYSVLDVKGAVLAVSQFTLFGDPWSGRRPFFGSAAAPQHAQSVFEGFVTELRRLGVPNVASGVFGAHMKVELVNDGPVTLWLDTKTKSD